MCKNNLELAVLKTDLTLNSTSGLLLCYFIDSFLNTKKIIISKLKKKQKNWELLFIQIKHISDLN